MCTLHRRRMRRMDYSSSMRTAAAVLVDQQLEADMRWMMVISVSSVNMSKDKDSLTIEI